MSIIQITRGTSTLLMATTMATRATTNTFGWFASRSEPAPPYFSLQAVDKVCLQSRKRKLCNVYTHLYEQNHRDNLLKIILQLQDQSWQVQPPVVFVVLKSMALEVYELQFVDRFVHQLLFFYLEPLLEKEFIYDATSNRKNEGAQFAVKRLQVFTRQRSHLRTGYFLQLEIPNFLNSLNLNVLLNLQSEKLAKWQLKKLIAKQLANQMYWLMRAIVHQKFSQASIHLGLKSEFAEVQKHTRLENKLQVQALFIGYFTSQLLANFYINEPEQLAKHKFKCRYNVRYVHYFELSHANKEQLQQWHQQIAVFASQRLKLALKSQFSLALFTEGADFLGYTVYMVVKKQVLINLHSKRIEFERQIIRINNLGGFYDLHPERMRELRATLESYWEYFKHTNSFRLCGNLFTRYVWLKLLCYLSDNHQQIIPIYQCRLLLKYKSQIRFFKQCYPNFALFIQYSLCNCGSGDANNPREAQSWLIKSFTLLRNRLEQKRLPYIFVNEQTCTTKIKLSAIRLIWHLNQNQFPKDYHYEIAA